MVKALKHAVVGLAMGLTASLVYAHGDVTPQVVDVSTLPPLGDDFKDENPYRGNKEAIKIGASAFNQNCARCHGLAAVSGGISPDLRKLDIDADTDQYFRDSVLAGKVRNGITYMPPFAAVFSQEAIWAIKSYIECRKPSLDDESKGNDCGDGH